MPDPGMSTVSNKYPRLKHHDLLSNGDPDYLRLILTSKVYEIVQETPLSFAPNLSARLGNQIYLKREDLQPVFSFKIRGAYNFMANLSEQERWRGNHAQGVALSGTNLKIPCTIVMPKATPSIKVKNVARLGAKIVLHGDDFDAAKSECMRLADSLGLVFVPPYDDPLVIAGQGTVAMEILKQTGHALDLDAVFASIGGGGLIAGIGQYIKRIGAPNTKVIGVETLDGDAMTRSLREGHRVSLSDVGPFSDGTAVKIVGEEPFRVCQHVVDSIVRVDTDAICAAIKDIFEETRSLTEPAGALALAGLKHYIIENKLVGANKKFVAVISGANINFDRLRFVAERAELGEGREALFTAEIPERPGSFFALHTVIHPRAVTEFCYRYSGNETAHIYLSFVLDATTPALRKAEIADIQVRLEAGGMHGRDISEDELAKGHARYLVGGRSEVPNERVFRFGKCLFFAIYIGKVLAGIQVPPAQYKEFDEFLVKLGYHYVEETDSEVYKRYLKR
ncbi:hypothetical protein Clacol_000594 [Clathrus columnatus]|uniref:Threonine dehydratase n=1 Tax=Clathrus columnatus TaxID=1419009 RepID=A0AAV5A193_9AGAM|nr:hypothetical protein Clacol_000594 [Clathrus columnatus]